LTSLIPAPLRRALALRPGEAEPALLSALCFFCVLAGWFVARPIRDAMGSIHDEHVLRYLFIATLLGMALLNPIFAWCISCFPRRIFAPAAFLIFAANLLLFSALLASVKTSTSLLWPSVFYVWSSVFNLFVISVFWALMADLWGRESGKRLFGLIAVGGTLGALLAGLFTTTYAKPLGVTTLLIIAALLMSSAALCVIRLNHLFTTRPSLRARDSLDSPDPAPQSDTPVSQGGAFGAFISISRSPALLAMSAYMIFFTSTQTYVYFEQQRIVKAAFGDNLEARTAAFAQLDVYVQSTTILLQLFGTSRIVRRLGIPASLATLPLIFLAGATALALAPTYTTLAIFQVARRAGDYALARPAREAWYAGLPRADKYKAKSFIDTFAYRAGDTLGAWALAPLKVALFGPLLSLAIFTPITLAWAALTLCLRSGSKNPSPPVGEVVRGSARTGGGDHHQPHA